MLRCKGISSQFSVVSYQLSVAWLCAPMNPSSKDLVPDPHERFCLLRAQFSVAASMQGFDEFNLPGGHAIALIVEQFVEHVFDI